MGVFHTAQLISHLEQFQQERITGGIIKTLNVAGSRGSKEPKVAAFVKQALEEAFYPRAEAMVVRR
jgi:hypothetical protein